jgi:hypothetical protein
LVKTSSSGQRKNYALFDFCSNISFVQQNVVFLLNKCCGFNSGLEKRSGSVSVSEFKNQPPAGLGCVNSGTRQALLYTPVLHVCKMCNGAFFESVHLFWQVSL